jgi:hypothetical protein
MMKRTANGITGLLSPVEKSFIEATRGATIQTTNNTIKASDARTYQRVVDRDDSTFMARRYQRDLHSRSRIGHSLGGGAAVPTGTSDVCVWRGLVLRRHPRS